MDVSCPRCQTEYDFDEARIPDDGITVKCTQCGHVFRVNRRTAAELPPAPVAREWKIRRRSTGTTSSCRELTSLQQWIVEGKVVRDDEISLTGDTWKRLGDIPELSSFFQVVDDAAKGRAYDAVRSAGQGSLPPPPPAPSLPPLRNDITETWREPNFKTPAPSVVAPPPAQSHDALLGGFAIPDQGAPKPLTQDLRPSGVRRKPLPATDDLDLERAIKGSGSRWPMMIVLGLLIGAGAGWYFGVHLPDKERRDVEARAALEPTVVDAGAPVAIVGVPAPTMVDAGAPTAPVAVAVIDAGAPVVATTLVEQTPTKPAKPEPKFDYDSLQARGESLLAQDKPEAALSAFGRASDLRPDRVEPMVGKGLALLDLGNAAAAEAAFEQANKLNPRYGPGIMGLAEALRTQGKYDKAITWYQRYLEVMPDGTEANVARNNIERLKK